MKKKSSSSFDFFFLFWERVDYFFCGARTQNKHSPILVFRTSTSAFSCVPTRFVLKVKFTHKARQRINLASLAITIRILVEEVCVKYAKMANRCSRFFCKTSKTCDFVSLSQNREKKSVAFNPTRWNIYAPRSGRSNERGIQPGEKEWIEKSAFIKVWGCSSFLAFVVSLFHAPIKYKTLNIRVERKKKRLEHVWFETHPTQRKI